MLEQFGWINTTYANEADDGKVAEIRSIRTTDFGDAMFEALGGTFEHFERDESVVEKKLKPIYSNWKTSLLPADSPFRDGRYTLKFAWLKVWRRVEAPANTTLETVTRLLLEAFAFSEDHLYQLVSRRRGSRSQGGGPKN